MFDIDDKVNINNKLYVSTEIFDKMTIIKSPTNARVITIGDKYIIKDECLAHDCIFGDPDMVDKMEEMFGKG